MALPTGVSLGDAGSALWGAAYYGGQKIAGVVNGQFQLADGTLAGHATDADWQAIADAENAQYNTPQQKAYQYQAVIDSPTTSPEVRTLYQSPEWKALPSGTNLSDPTVWNSLSADLKSRIQAIPNLYNNILLGLGASSAPSTTQPTAPASTTAAPATNSSSVIPSTLADLVASASSFTHASTGASSGNSGGGITIAAPVAGSATAPTSSGSPLRILLVVGIVVAIVYFYHRHNAKKAA